MARIWTGVQPVCERCGPVSADEVRSNGWTGSTRNHIHVRVLEVDGHTRWVRCGSVSWG